MLPASHRSRRLLASCLLIPALLAVLTGCRSQTAPSTEPASPAPVREDATLLDRQLYRVLELERALDAAAAEPDAQFGYIQRRFQEVAQLYRGILARNPDSLYARLLFAKLLSRFGDADGAREQFLLAAKIDPNLAVIHQELSTYYAETGDPTRALAYALNAVGLEPDTPAYQFGLGQVLTAYRSFYLAEGVFGQDQIDSEILKAFKSAASLAPDQLDLQFRYGEAFYDVANPDWQIALRHWNALLLNEALLPVQIQAIHLHRARCLLALNRPDEAAAAASLVSFPDLIPSRDALQIP